MGIRGKASALCKGRSTGKEGEKDRRRGGGTCGQATRSAARIEEESSGRVEKESKGTLWQRSARRSMSTGVGVVYKRSGSVVYGM